MNPDVLFSPSCRRQTYDNRDEHRAMPTSFANLLGRLWSGEV